MLEKLWTSILELTSQFVTPDWGKLINYMPVAIVLVVVLILLWLFRSLARAKPARRGPGPVTARTPAGIHMPGPSFAPVFAGIGLFMIMLGLVFGGVSLVLGAIALVLTLLYWLAEGLRIYDHDIGPTSTIVPAVGQAGPPPGVHMPGPSWRPFLGALGLFAVMLGLVFGGWVLAAGVIVLILTLVGWGADAVKEYRKTVEADATGHLENIPTAGTPRGLLTAVAVLILIAGVMQSGVFATGSASGDSGTPGASGGPARSGAPAGSGAPGSGGPQPSSAAADVTVKAQGVAFVTSSWTGPAGKAFTIAFDNEDPGTPHNIEIKDGSGAVAFKGEIFSGVATKIYQVPALPAGAYTFVCLVHPSMTGTATLQ